MAERKEGFISLPQSYGFRWFARGLKSARYLIKFTLEIKPSILIGHHKTDPEDYLVLLFFRLILSRVSRFYGNAE